MLDLLIIKIKKFISKLHLNLLNKFSDKILAIDKNVLKTVLIKNKSVVLNILDFKCNRLKKLVKIKNF